MNILCSDNFAIPAEYEKKEMDYFRKLWHEGMNKIVVPEGYGDFEYLKRRSLEGLYRRYSSITDEIKLRIEYELDTIKLTDLIGPFLVSYDLVLFAKSKGIVVSPGCGAYPGSLVSYCLEITDIDPFKYNLIFERLINKTRTVDYLGHAIQLELGGSKQLTEYVIKKYGKGMPELLKSIDIRLCELKELSIIKDTIRRVSANTGNPIDISKIDFSDAAVFEYIKAETNEDIFLLDEICSKEFVTKQRICSFEDLIARLALDRPGPDYYNCPRYIENQNYPDQIQYEFPELRSILDPTYGCIVYQEQIMQILNMIGGFSLEQSDLARRNMAKRLLASVEKEREDFILGNAEEGISGCVAKGFDKNFAGQLYDRVSYAAAYAFNRSHAVGCAMITYQMAWLKYYFNLEFVQTVHDYKSNEFVK